MFTQFKRVSIIKSKYLGICYSFNCDNCNRKIYEQEYEVKKEKYFCKNCNKRIIFNFDK